MSSPSDEIRKSKPTTANQVYFKAVLEQNKLLKEQLSFFERQEKYIKSISHHIGCIYYILFFSIVVPIFLGILGFIALVFLSLLVNSVDLGAEQTFSSY